VRRQAAEFVPEPKPGFFQALSALFLMNNTHYLLKAVQLSRQFSFISKEWRGDCKAKASHGTSLA